jgi:hypothetical protein
VTVVPSKQCKSKLLVLITLPLRREEESEEGKREGEEGTNATTLVCKEERVHSLKMGKENEKRRRG